MTEIQKPASITMLRVKGKPLLDGIQTLTLTILWSAARAVREKYNLQQVEDDAVVVPFFDLEYNCKLTVIQWTGARPNTEQFFYPRDFEIVFETDADRTFFLLRFNDGTDSGFITA